MRGLDLSRHYLDVRRVTLGVYGEWIDASGLDREEVVSDVCARILRANGGRSPYDPSRSSLSRYVAMQARSAILNALQVRARRAVHEQVGVVVGEQWQDAAQASGAPDDSLDAWISEHLPGLDPLARVALHRAVQARDAEAGRAVLGEERWAELELCVALVCDR